MKAKSLCIKKNISASNLLEFVLTHTLVPANVIHLNNLLLRHF